MPREIKNVFKEEFTYDTPIMSESYRDRWVSKANNLEIHEVGIDEVTDFGDTTHRQYVVVKIYLDMEIDRPD